MAKLARLPVRESALGSAVASIRRVSRVRPRYFAFLSYSHKDEEVADWLHRELEGFRVPAALAGKLTANGVTPKRLTPIFRDEHELAAADDLGEEIEEALSSSQFLIVLCSPNAAGSRWTNAEIEVFKRARPDGCVLAAITAGEPFASDMPGREDEECFPPALRQKYDRRGRPTSKRAEPLAADLREEGDGRRMGFLKLVAGMLGVGLDELVQRETTRRHRRLAWLAAGSLAGMTVTSGLAITAIQARDAARDQRREAEGLVAFMLGDLKDKLEPIGRLDALDGVGSKVLAYYSKQDTSDLSDASLLQRSRALNLMGQVAFGRGNLDSAEKLYRESMVGTAEAIRRNPDDPQRLFDHAQSEFSIFEIARARGNAQAAEAAAREYKRLAIRMVALDPNNMKWRVEEQSADANLGIALYSQRRYPEAATQFEQALQSIDAFARADPRNTDFQKSLADSVAWLADARMAEGRLDDAVALRKRHIGLLNRLLLDSGGDVAFKDKLVAAHRALGNLYAWQGQLRPAIQQLEAAVSDADQLVHIERSNRQWIDYSANAHVILAGLLLASDREEEAVSQANAACNLAGELTAVAPTNQQWRATYRDCLLMRTRLALASRTSGDAKSPAEAAIVAAKAVRTNDNVNDRFAIARAYRLLGDAFQRSGELKTAKTEWSNAFAALPVGAAERPSEMSERYAILQRIGQAAAAGQIKQKLKDIGYRATT